MTVSSVRVVTRVEVFMRRSCVVSIVGLMALILAGCQDSNPPPNAPSSNAPRTMKTGTSANLNATSSTSFQELPAVPSISVSTTQGSSITADFVAECRVTSGGALHVRITIDGQVAAPDVAVLTSDDKWATHSYRAMIPSVTAGSHRATVQWRSATGASVYIRKRSFTVWES
jgi:hypothetical protein